MRFLHWIHHLFNPHCVECRDDANNTELHQALELVKMQLAIANAEKQRMLDALLDKPKPETEPTKVIEPKEIRARTMTWNMRRQMLEQEDRIAAKVKREQEDHARKAKEISDLEKELGVHAQAEGRNDEEVIQSSSDEEGQVEVQPIHRQRIQ